MKTALLTTELLPTVGTGSNGPPALADVDGDGTLEIGTMSAIGPAYVFRHDGVSFFGRHPTGEDRTLETEHFGADSQRARHAELRRARRGDAGPDSPAPPPATSCWRRRPGSAS